MTPLTQNSGKGKNAVTKSHLVVAKGRRRERSLNRKNQRERSAVEDMFQIMTVLPITELQNKLYFGVIIQKYNL